MNSDYLTISEINRIIKNTIEDNDELDENDEVNGNREVTSVNITGDLTPANIKSALTASNIQLEEGQDVKAEVNPATGKLEAVIYNKADNSEVQRIEIKHCNVEHNDAPARNKHLANLNPIPAGKTVVARNGDSPWRIARRELEAANPGVQITDTQVWYYVLEIGKLNKDKYGENPTMASMNNTILFIGESLKVA